MTDYAYQVGDTVQVTFAGKVVRGEQPGLLIEHADISPGYYARVPHSATVEVIERADDPSKDPVGTVRTDGYSTAVKTGNYHLSKEAYEDRLKNGWVLIGNGAHEYAHKVDSVVTGWVVIGAVPGTPAAEAQKPRWEQELCEPWTGDGGEEPPAHVLKVAWSGYGPGNASEHLVRRDDGWSWEHIDYVQFSSLAQVLRGRGDTYTEVLPE